jgi:hypothetical protein
MTKTKVMRLLFAAAIVVFAAPSASAQNAASNKAVFAYNPDGVSVSSFFDRVELFSLPSIIKTSSNGSLLLGLSMECSLYTYNSVTSTGGGSKNSSSARATVRAWVYVDGVLATPDGVVFCERLQAVGVTLNTGDATDTITIELFQRTKEANHFNYFKGPLDPILHSIRVLVSGDVQCTNNVGATLACSTGTLAGFSTGTFVAIGKSVLAVEEYNNSNLR